MKRPFAVAILLLGVTAVYAPALWDGFVWDDTALILRDPLIRSWRLIPEGFNHYLFVDATPSDFYRPLQRLTYTIEYCLFAVRPAPYHLTSVLLHAAAAIALFFFAESLFIAFACPNARARRLALIGSFIWAIHPVHTSAIVYVSGRADPLAAFFGFTGCYLALRYFGQPGRSSAVLLLGAGISFLCSALSKESGLMFPLLMATLLMILKLRRAALAVAGVAMLVLAFYLSLRLPAEHTSPPHFGTTPPPATRPITMARAVAEYAGLLVWPVNLHMERDLGVSFTHNLYNDTSASAARELQTLAGVAITAAAMFCAFRIRRRHRLIFALLIAATVSYLPVSDLLQLNAAVAEHWIYVPSAFLLLGLAAAGWETVDFLFRSRTRLLVSTVAFASWLLFLGARTFDRTFDWKDQRTFLERTIAAGGRSARMLINLGALESSEGHLDLAKRYLTEALKKEPDQPFATIDLATVLLKQSDFEGARQMLGRALSMPLVENKAHELLAILENKQNGRLDLMRLRLAAHSGYADWLIEKRYIKLLAETGAVGAAIQEVRTCLQTDWYRAESWQLLGELLARYGQNAASAEALAMANSYDLHLSRRPAAL
ncbi:MAG: tetratricopeptide repeat protein [Chthoniobacterales bacterium]